MKEVWLVMGCRGSWGNYTEYPIKAFSNELDAKAFSVMQEARLAEENTVAHAQQEAFDKEYNEWVDKVDDVPAEEWTVIIGRLYEKYPKTRMAYELYHTYRVIGPIPFFP